jgi:hypothetical protein
VGILKNQTPMKSETNNDTATGHTEQLVSRYLRQSRECREPALERMISDLWRNHPEWPSTFGPCSEGCGNLGRGSGPCADCIERAIGLLVGQPMAACGLHIAIHRTREESRKLRDLISGPNVDAGGEAPCADVARGNFLPDNPTQFDYLHAIRAIASRIGNKQIFDLADAGMNLADAEATCSSSSDTPETDAATLRATDIEGGGEFDAVHVQVAKRLERERDKARTAARKLRDAFANGERLPWENETSPSA